MMTLITLVGVVMGLAFIGMVIAAVGQSIREWISDRIG